jgi:flagellar hook-length control protein FliK
MRAEDAGGTSEQSSPDSTPEVTPPDPAQRVAPNDDTEHRGEVAARFGQAAGKPPILPEAINKAPRAADAPKAIAASGAPATEAVPSDMAGAADDVATAGGRAAGQDQFRQAAPSGTSRVENAVQPVPAGSAFEQEGAPDERARGGTSGNVPPEALQLTRAAAFRAAAIQTLAASLMQDAVTTPAPGLLMAPATRALPAWPDSESLDRMVQTLRVMVKDRVSEATVRLRPEHLGEVSIDIRVDGRTVTAIIRAESAVVREWLQLQEDAVRNGLSQQGLHLERLIVQRDGKRERREQQAGDPRRSKPRRQSEPDTRFDVSA